MTTATISTETRGASVADSFAYGVLIMLLINVGQRVIGLVRNLGFCQFLSDAELGHWALANSFFIIAAPIAVLGLPGSFGKFVEFYRQRGQLRTYLARVTAVCVISTCALAAAIFADSNLFAWFIYGDDASMAVVGWTAIALIAQVGYNFAFETTLALRQVRVISWMQMANGISFTVIGIGWLAFGHHWSVLLPSYAIACMLGMFVGLWFIWTNNHHELRASSSITHRAMWPRIIPFAVALWITNLLSNSFELSDRYMLLHLSPGGETVGQALVGQYYCGRIVPNLLTSVALMLGGILVPYLSKDWEAGLHQAIQRRMRLILSVISLGFMAISVVAILASPLLFDGLFAGRYAGAQAILNLSLLQCVWASIYIVAGGYLMCAERVHSGSINLLIGLVVNIVLNVPLIHYFGLTGSVAATAIANLVVMLLTFHSLHRHGCDLGSRTLLLALLPVLLLSGAVMATVGIVVLIFIVGRTNWILSSEDRAEVDAFVLPKLNQAGIRLQSLWP